MISSYFDDVTVRRSRVCRVDTVVVYRGRVVYVFMNEHLKNNLVHKRKEGTYT